MESKVKIQLDDKQGFQSNRVLQDSKLKEVLFKVISRMTSLGQFKTHGDNCRLASAADYFNSIDFNLDVNIITDGTLLSIKIDDFTDKCKIVFNMGYYGKMTLALKKDERDALLETIILQTVRIKEHMINVLDEKILKK